MGLQECICNRWRLYDINIYTKPIAYLYGNDRKIRPPCNGAIEER